MSADYEPSGPQWVRDQVQQIESSGTTEVVGVNGMAVVLMTYRGVSGKLRKTPVMRVEHEGRYAAVASKGGAPANPKWYSSLAAGPVVELRDGTAAGEYRPREVFGEERAQWWRRAVDAYPDYADYQRNTEREIPVFVLEPVGRQSG